MKAAILTELRKPFTIGDVPIPEIDASEVLVKTSSCGICRTDLHIQDGLAYVPRLPHVPGHEPAGTVERVGSAVRNVRPGDRVVPHLFPACHACRYCRTGNHSQCSDTQGIIGVTTSGGFAEYFKAPASSLLKIPDNVSFEDAGLVSCAIITAVRAVRRSRITFGESAVVIGAGGIGLIVIQMLRAFGVRTAAISRSERSREMAEAAGAGLALLSSHPALVERVANFSGDDGASCAFDLVGTAETLRLSASCVQRMGRVVVIGEEAESLPVHSIEIAQRELEIIGSRNGGMQDAIDGLGLLSSGVIRPAIAARMPLEGFNDALRLMRSGEVTGRVVIQLS